MPLGFFGTSSSGVKPQQLANPIEDSGCSSASESRDSRGTVIKLPHHTVTIERKLAEGGFAIVYLVSDKTNRHYALKRQFISDDTRQLEACKRECRIVSCLASHKNIVEYVDHSILRNRSGVYEYSLLTAYYKNSVLQLINDRIMAGRCLSANEILAIFCDMCEAVARLHHSQTPVIHRDLKVENVLIDNRRRGTPPIYVLCDFGSATTKILSTESYSMQYIEEEIQRYTTLSYRAPEMIDLYSNKPIGTKIDIWALGVMLYKMCYFMLPFGESALAIQNCAYSFPTEPQYPDELRAIIKVLLEGDIAKRPDIFQTASLAFEARSMRSPVGNLNKVKPIPMSDALAILRGEYSQSSQGQQQPTQTQAIPSSSTQKSPDSPSTLIRTFEQKGSSAANALNTANSQPVIVNINPRLRPKPLSAANHPIGSRAFPTVGSTPGLICSSVTQASKSHDQTDAKNVCPSAAAGTPAAPASLLTTTICRTSATKTSDHPLGFTNLEEQVPCAATVTSSYSSAAGGDGSSVAALGATPAIRGRIVVDRKNTTTTRNSDNSNTSTNNKFELEFENESESNESENNVNLNFDQNQKRKINDENGKTPTTNKQQQKQPHQQQNQQHEYHLSIHGSAPQLFHERTIQTAIFGTTHNPDGSSDGGIGNRGIMVGGVVAGGGKFSNHEVDVASVSAGGVVSADDPLGSSGGTLLKLSAFKPYSTVSTSAKKKSSINDVNAIVTTEFDVDLCNWNPFVNAPYKECTKTADETATKTKRNAMDDRSFGRCFDELPRSNQRTSVGGGTRNECYDQPVVNFDPSDPFDAAPFTPLNLRRVLMAADSSQQQQQDKKQNSDNEKTAVNFYAETGCAVLEDESECDEVRMESRRRFSYEHFDGVGDNASSESRDPQDDFTSEDDDVTKAEGISDWSTSRSHEGGVEWMLSDENAQHEDEKEDENNSNGGDMNASDYAGDNGRRKQMEERRRLQLLLLLSNNDANDDSNKSNMKKQKISSSSFPSSSLTANKSENLQRNIEETIKISDSSSALSLLENISTYNTTESSLSASSGDSSSTSTTTSEFAFTQSFALNDGKHAEQKLPSRPVAAASKSIQSEIALRQQQALNNSAKITTTTSTQNKNDESDLQRKFINPPERCSISLNNSDCNDHDQQQEHYYYYYGNENKQNIHQNIASNSSSDNDNETSNNQLSSNMMKLNTETMPTNAAVLHQQFQSGGVYHQYYQTATTTTNPFASEAAAAAVAVAAAACEKAHSENSSSAQTTHPLPPIIVSSIFTDDVHNIRKQQQPSSSSFPSTSSSSPFVVHRLTSATPSTTITGTGEVTRVEAKPGDRNPNLNLGLNQGPISNSNQNSSLPSPPTSSVPVSDATTVLMTTTAAAPTQQQQQQSATCSAASVDASCSTSLMSHHATCITATNAANICAHSTSKTSSLSSPPCSSHHRDCCCHSVGSVTADMIAAIDVQPENASTNEIGTFRTDSDDLTDSVIAGCGDAQTRLRAKTLPTTISEQPIAKTKRFPLTDTEKKNKSSTEKSGRKQQQQQQSTPDMGGSCSTFETITAFIMSPREKHRNKFSSSANAAASSSKRVSLSHTSSSSDDQSAQTTTDDSGAEMFSGDSSTTNAKSPLVAAMVGRMHHHHHQRKKSSGKCSSSLATLNASSFVNSTFQGEDFETPTPTPTSATATAMNLGEKDMMSRKSSSFSYYDQNQTTIPSSTKKSIRNNTTSSDNNNNNNSKKKKATNVIH